jgi:hypothetical protein
MKGIRNQLKIDIPIRLVFTGDGITYFTSSRTKLTRFRLSDNREEYGIELIDFRPLCFWEKVCAKMSLNFESSVNLDPVNSQTFLNLILLF